MTGPAGHAGERRCSAALPGRASRAFTLTDVLVTMAVVALLIGIMLPGMSRARELSKQVVCRSNLRQVGLGLALYADSARDQLPYSVYLHQGQPPEDSVPYQPEAMMTLRLRPIDERVTGQRWDGLGRLFEGEFLPSREVFYCPSHHGQHSPDAYISRWQGQRGEIVGNYHYRGKGPNGSTRLSFIEPSRAALGSDGMRTIEDYNHLVGLNVLRADLSLFWLGDPQGRIGEFLAEADGEWDQSMRFDRLWEHLDSPGDVFLPDSE